MIESIETLDGKTIYWMGGKPRRGIIVERGQNCVTDEIASGFELGDEMLAKAVCGMEYGKIRAAAIADVSDLLMECDSELSARAAGRPIEKDTAFNLSVRCRLLRATIQDM